MAKNILINFVLSLFLIVFAYSLTLLAQEKICNLKIKLSESETGKAVEDGDVAVFNTQLRKEVKAEIQNPSNSSNVKEGSYEIRVDKNGFKQSLIKTDFVCGALDKENFAVVSVWMWQGNSKEKVEYEKSGIATKIERVTDSSKLSERERLKELAKRSNILNFDAIYLAAPKYPARARAAKISGIVYVQITVNENGSVELAEAIEGDLLLQEAAVNAAQKAKFNPLIKDGKATKFSGKLIYIFTYK